MGPLIKCFGPRGPRELAIASNASVASACNKHGWMLRGARSPAAENLHIYLTTIPLPSSSNQPDSYEWEANGISLHRFSAKATWEDLRPRDTVKPWTSSVWFSGSVPKHAFTLWVAHQDRLPTRQRLAQWGIPVPLTCCLCNTYAENRDHLFLRCEWSEQLWYMVLHRLGAKPIAFHTWTAFC